MTNILKLQKLTLDPKMDETDNLFASAISTICPADAGGEAGSMFEME